MMTNKMTVNVSKKANDSMTMMYDVRYIVYKANDSMTMMYDVRYIVYILHQCFIYNVLLQLLLLGLLIYKLD
jgi:ATP-dependent Clp protease adapter protein ClpS